MARPRTKEDLLEAAVSNYGKLMEFISTMSEKELNTPFDFSFDTSKKEAHWQRDKNLRDVLVHQYEWQQLQIAFVEKNKASNGGITFSFLPAAYTWKTYGDMNTAIFLKHKNTTLEQARLLLEESHNIVIKMAEGFTNEELFTKKHFKWTGTTDLGSYFVSTLSSHYDWALKKLKAHRKNLSEKK